MHGNRLWGFYERLGEFEGDEASANDESELDEAVIAETQYLVIGRQLRMEDCK